jgi:hypothetical protein
VRRPTGSFWPSRTQELLLRTALAEPEGDLAAWHELQPGFDLTTLEFGTVGVLPLVYRVVSGVLADDPLLPRLKGTYRNSWVKNNVLVERLAEAADALEAMGVETVMIGSLAAAVRYYPELPLRPTPALELLIEPQALEVCARALGRLGFSASGPLRAEREEDFAFYDAQGQTCVLRTRPSVELAPDGDGMRAASVWVEVGRSRIRALAAGDDLLVACVAGARTRPIRSVQWLVDIVQILRTSSAGVDWRRLLALAAGRGQTLRLQQTFSYLSTVLGVPTPPEADEAFAELPVTMRDRIAYACAGASMNGLGSLPQALGEHLVATRRRSPWGTLVTLPGFLRRRWELDHGWQLPLAGGRRAYGALTRSREREA